MKSPTAFLVASLLTPALGASAQDLPTVRVTSDNTRIDKSCVVEIPADAVIADADGNGALHISGQGITVRFAEGSALRGAPADTPWNELTGTGIRIEGGSDITLENLRVHGYHNGLHATGSHGLHIAGGDYSDNYRAKLTSTAEREGGGDWLHPHNNDNNEWLSQYGAAIYIEDAQNVTVRDVYIRRGQNGILFDRVNHSKVYDNDASFLSGWGLALWRSSDNTITRNAFDFCVRGHSEGVYNRGQDSAGILFFEQCNRNVVVENSATHGGDGFFGFAGLEALGLPDKVDPELDYERVGCNDNIFVKNDLSYAPAHGLEMTFGFGNIIADNRFVENAICGVWGGFSQDTLIYRNEFRGNGGMAYGLERGGVNIEHSIDNLIIDNRFENNRVGVGLWYDDPGQIATLPWGQKNYGPLTGNVIADNTFVINAEPQPFHNVPEGEKHIAILLRDDSEAGKLAPVMLSGNEVKVDPAIGQEVVTWNNTSTTEGTWDQTVSMPDYEVLGDNNPVGARKELRGRHMIIMDQWGPWNHQGVFTRPVSSSASEHAVEVFGVDDLQVQVTGQGVSAEVTDSDALPGAKLVTLKSEPGAHAYEAVLRSGDWSHEISGSLVSAKWRVVAFNWPQEIDPREQEKQWRALAARDEAVRFTTDALNFPFGMGGPSHAGVSEALTRANLAPDRFGIIAQTRLPLTAGKWRIRTVSDDGIRVWVDGEQVIDNWDWHAAETDTAEFTVDRNRAVTIELAYFELDGGATLSFEIEPVK